MNPFGAALSSERPFPGLRPFAYADHAYFFGRQEQTYALYRLIDSSRFVAVIGSSGSGKSSLVRAGLLPLLDEESAEREGAEDGRRWLWRVMSPGDAPLDRLTEVLANLSTDDDPVVSEARKRRIDYHIRRSSFGMADALREIDGLQRKSLFLVVDQFEELFRFASSTTRRGVSRHADERARDAAAQFVQILLEIDRDPDIDVHVLITMRSDFVGDCARFHGLPEAVSATQFLVPSLTRGQLEEVICKPIDKAGAAIDPTLVERLLIDSGDEPDQLPVLQHCLLRLWEQAGTLRRTGEDISSPLRNLTLSDYAKVGGIANGLSQHADEILAGLPGRELAVEQAFRALAERDKEHREVRRALLYSQLLAESGVAEAELRQVLDRFRADDCSFLTPSISARTEIGPETRIDVGHEALLRRWERVCGDPDSPDVKDASTASDGWLGAEERDGRLYRSLLGLLDHEGRVAGSLPLPIVRERWAWWTARPRTSAWAERYGGHYEAVGRLLKEGVRALEAEASRARRIRWTAGAGVAAILLLALAGVFMISWSRQQSANARSNFELVESSTKRLLDRILASSNAGDISVKGARDLLTTEAEIVHRMGEAESIPDTKAIRAQLLLTLSDVYVHAQDSKQAMSYASEAEAIADQLAQISPDNVKWQHLVYSATTRVANLAPRDQSLQKYRKAQVAIERVVASEPDNVDWQLDRGIVHGRIAELLNAGSDAAGATQENRQYLDLLRGLVDKNPQRADLRRELASAEQRVGRLLLSTSSLRQQDSGAATASQRQLGTDRELTLGPPDQAVLLLRSALDIRVKLVEDDPENDVYRSNLSSSYTDMATVLELQGRWDDSLAERRLGIATYQRLVRKDANNAQWKDFLAGTLEDTITALQKRRNHGLSTEDSEFHTLTEEIVSDYQLHLTLRQELADIEPSDMRKQRALATAAEATGDFLLARNPSEALRNYRLALETRERISHIESRCDDSCLQRIASDDIGIGDALLMSPQNGSSKSFQSTQIEALDSYRKARTALEQAGPSSATDPALQKEYALARDKAESLAPGP